MMDVWRQRGLAVLLLIARLAPSSLALSNRPDLGQKPWDSVHITKSPWKRDASACPSSYSSCAESLGGACCPTDRSCGTDSCYATTAAVETACSISGYVACGSDQGGGCCPRGYSCANDGCIPLSGATDTMTCDMGSFSCAESLGGGCCKNEYACGAGNICYQTSFSSVSLTQTLVTTDSNAQFITITTTYLTAYQQTYTPIPGASMSSAVAKVTVTATAVPKVDPVSNSGGLTKAQLGGVVAAAIIILLAVFLAAFCIIRRLNAVVQSQKTSRNTSSGANTRSHNRNKPRRSQTSTADIDYDALSIDPFMETGASTTQSRSVRLPRPSAVHSNLTELDSNASSPPIPEPYGSPHSHPGPGYQQVPSFDQTYFDVPLNRRRNYSIDTDPHTVSPPVGTATYGGGSYFDPSDPSIRDQNLRFGHFTPPRSRSRPSVHGRHWSDASDLSAQSGVSGNGEAIELDGGPVDERHASVGSIVSVMQRMGLSRTRSSRRYSQEGRRNSGSSATARSTGGGAEAGVYPSQAQRLDRVQEASHIALDQQPAKPKEEEVVSQRDMESGSSPRRNQPHGGRFREEGLGIQAVPPLERELERLEGQKSIENVHELMGRMRENG